jgi:hypothetical protein
MDDITTPEQFAEVLSILTGGRIQAVVRHKLEFTVELPRLIRRCPGAGGERGSSRNAVSGPRSLLQHDPRADRLFEILSRGLDHQERSGLARSRRRCHSGVIRVD